MDYKCHCGAPLEYTPKEKRWLCPMGHPVYLCKNCQSSNRIAPLQWIEQYKRWYCYECKEYAPIAGTDQIEKAVDQAIEELKHTIDGDPDNADAHCNLGVAYRKKGWIDQAIVEYERSVELNPNIADAHVNLGAAYDSKGWTDRAITEFKRAIEIDPDAADAHYNLGTAYGKKGLLDEALRELERALELDPNDAQVHGNIALVHCRSKRIDSAWTHARIAGKLGLPTQELDQLIAELLDTGPPSAEMYLFRVLKSISSGEGWNTWQTEATPLPLDRSELKERSSESKMGLFSVKDARYYVIAVDNLTRILWVWDQTPVKGMAAKFWTMSHKDFDCPHDLIADTLGRKELRSYKYRQIFRDNEPPEFWFMFSHVNQTQT